MFSCSEHLKPIAAEERRLEEEEKKAREEQERIAKQLAEGESPVSPPAGCTDTSAENTGFMIPVRHLKE